MDPLPKRIQLPHEIPEWVDPAQEVYFVTLCSEPKGFNQICVPGTAEKLIDSVKFRHDQQIWFVHVLLLMPDHVHAPISFFQDQVSIRQSIGSWKSFTAKTLGIKWQKSYFEHRLRSDESFTEKAEYIMNNPVRAGLATKSEEWAHVFKGE